MSETTNLKLFKHDNPATNENQFDVTKALNNNWDKIDDFAETTNTKITENQNNIKSLQTDNTTNKQDIAILKSDNTTNKANIKALQDDNKTNKDNIEELQQKNKELEAENERLRQDMNAYPSNTAEGEYITLTDSADSRFNKFKVLGKSTQATRSGKNMIHIIRATETNNGITFTNNEDGSVTINGTATANAYYNLNIIDSETREYFTCIKNEYYGLYIGKSAEGLNFVIRSRTKNYQMLQTTLNVIERVQQYTDETDEECYAYLAVQSGTTINNLTVYPMFVHGSEIGDYEPFGAMPSTDYRSDSQNVTDNIDIIVANENLFLNGFSTPKTNTDFWKSISSKFTPLENGWGKFSYTNSGSSTVYLGAYTNIEYWKKIIKLNTEYTVIAEWKNANLSAGDNFAILDNNSYSIFNGSLTINSSDGKSGVKIQKFTTKNNFDGIRFLFRSFMAMASGSTASIELRVSLIEGDTTETEVKVENQEFVFPLAEGQVLREGDYLADDGIHHKRKQIEIDISQFATGMPYKGTFSVSNNKIRWDYTSVKGICNYFNNAESEQVTENFSASQYINDNEFNFRMGNTKDRIYFKNSAFTTLEQWRDFFNNNEVIVEYECNEYVEAYTDEQKQVYDEIVKTAKTYKTVTNIFSTNEVSPKFEIEYRQDIKALINNVSQAVLNNA